MAQGGCTLTKERLPRLNASMREAWSGIVPFHGGFEGDGCVSKMALGKWP
eukprot:CAMPEP_0174366798 /NCGR_PEP_ID=MMETSP0811_2-20130205/82637_1 /TAXON_ID=73025 ORGANISM="Eutreptiella gymnastica-like, Strain CCMP1594" /NCGR_SAMPLE_ID=MMETSP0811_2 /ASSEMBLY_ACC=CAM_ASM_000667 /LENGTH=49 /DNA_ID=CAMNT_0015508713 /DNA_START=11 /DNA_END=160 /DNA_ORIENTATION=-